MLEYEVSVERIDAHDSVARCKDAEITLDTDVNGCLDAFNPAELLLDSPPKMARINYEVTIDTDEDNWC